MNSIKKNYFLQAIYQVLLISIALITTPYISRVFGPDGIGLYSYSYSIVNLFVIFSLLGITNYGSRTISSILHDYDETKKTFQELVLIHGIVTIILLVVFYVISVIAFKENIVLYAVQSIFLFATIVDISWYYFGKENHKLLVIRNIVIKLLALAAIFLFVKDENDLLIYTLIMSLSVLISNLILVIQLPKDYLIFKFYELKPTRHLKELLILFIPVVAVSIYKYMDKVMLGSFTNMTQTGYYESAEKIIQIPSGIITALGIVMLSRISNLRQNGKHDLIIKYINNSISYIAFISTALMFGISAVSDEFTVMFFGMDFLPASNLIKVFSVTLVFTSWANVIRTHYLLPYRYDKPYVVAVILGACFNLLFNFILIPKYEALGAVIATLVAEIIVAVVQTIYVRKRLPIGKNIVKFIPFIIIGYSMMLLIRYLDFNITNEYVNLAVSIMIGSIYYLVLSGLIIYIFKDKYIDSVFKYD